MARDGITQESLASVLDCIDAKSSFLLEAGAGSGKTWTLVESLRYILLHQTDFLETNNKRIVCITYTNVAKNEISERIDFNPLVSVSTIHDFLWSCISGFQAELKEFLIEANTTSKKPVEDLEVHLKRKHVNYSPYGRNLILGQVTHDDVIDAATKLFEKYPKIAKITADKYPYIFVDEYQDTQPQTVSLLLDNLLERQSDKVSLGFFGDSMQKIYGAGIGKIESDRLTQITKLENFRCSLAVIELLNKIRTNLKQQPGDKNLAGSIQFFHSNTDLDNPDNYNKVRAFLEKTQDWKFDSSTGVVNTKILQLTHKGIAKRLGYETLLNIYDDYISFGRDRLFDKEEIFSNFFLDKVERLVELYAAKEYSEFIQLLANDGRNIRKAADKQRILNLMEGLDVHRTKGTVKDVYDYVLTEGLLIKPSKIEEFEYLIKQPIIDEKIGQKKLFYQQLMALKYSEIAGIAQFINESTPFSTKHGVKGAEYNDVVVVIDDTSWNQYKFNDVFSGDKSKIDRYNRSLNLLYVCCSRAKNRLVVIALSKMDAIALTNIESWFGKANVRDIKSL